MAQTNVFESQVDNRAAEYGQAFAQGAAQSLEQKLLNMAKAKVDKMTAGHLKTLLPNATDQELAALAHLGPNTYDTALRGGFGSLQRASQNAQNAQNIQAPERPQVNIESAKTIDYLRGLSQFGLHISPEQEKRFMALPEDQQEKVAEQIFNKLPQQYRSKIDEAISQQQLPRSLQQNENELQPQDNMRPQQVIGSQQPGVAPQQQRRSFSEAAQLAGVKSTAATRAAELEFRKEQAAKKETRQDIKQEKEEEKESRKINKDYIEKLQDNADSSRKNINTYKQIIKLANTGKVRSGSIHQLLDKVGLADLARNIETQVTDKLAKGLAQNAGAAFNTSRLTNLDVGLYQDSVLSLKNDQQGLVTLAELNMLNDEANILKNQIRRDVIRDNEGKIPFDLRDQVDTRAEPELQKLANEAMSILQNAVSGESFTEFNGTLLPSDSFKYTPETIFSDKGINYAPDGKGGWRIV